MSRPRRLERRVLTSNDDYPSSIPPLYPWLCPRDSKASFQSHIFTEAFCLFISLIRCLCLLSQHTTSFVESTPSRVQPSASVYKPVYNLIPVQALPEQPRAQHIHPVMPSHTPQGLAATLHNNCQPNQAGHGRNPPPMNYHLPFEDNIPNASPPTVIFITAARQGTGM
jgi:hypothetical protein